MPLESKVNGLHCQRPLKVPVDAKRLSVALPNKSAPERPPDPENRSPGAARTAAGAEVQRVLQRTASSYPENGAHANSATAERQDTLSLRIVIEPTASRRKWTARLGDRVVCRSAWPFVMSARLLLAEGYPADIVIEMWRPNTDEWALRGCVGAVAATVIDGETASRRAKNGSAVRFPGTATSLAKPTIAERTP